jgi:hypothetical protein
MKGTRSNQMSSLKSELSGEPILRPFTATSKYSGNPSPTFDMNASNDNQSPNKYGDEAMQAAFGDMVIFIEIKILRIIFKVFFYNLLGSFST